MSRYASLIISLLLLATELHSQALVSAKILNTRQEPLSGATVQALHNRMVVKTNRDGFFELLLKTLPDTLRFSYVGYAAASLFVSSSGRLDNIILTAREDALETVTVNTGYQKLRPNEVNGAVTVIDNKLLNQQTGTNILQRLNGVTNGLIFNTGKGGPDGQTNDISIRGLSTINGPLSPLIVLDNFPYEGDINNINPNDVESITILKDAAAASIWGARAGNGVIVITTKKGKLNEPLRVSINTSVQFQQPQDLFYKPQLPVSDYLLVEQTLFNKGYFNGLLNDVGRSPFSPAAGIFVKRQQGLISSRDSASLMAELKQNDTRQQYNQYFQHTGITQQHTISLRGGGEKNSWLLAGNYNRVNANDRSFSEKINLHSDNRIQPFKNLEIRLGVYYTNNNSKSGMPNFSTLSQQKGRYLPYLEFISSSSPVPIDKYNRNYTDTAGAGRLLNWNYYPLEDYKHDYTQSNLQDIIVQAGFTYKVWRALSFNVDYQYEKQWTSGNRVADTASFYNRSLINKFTSLPATASQPPIYTIPRGDMITKTTGAGYFKNLRGQLNFSKAWAQHNLSLIAGAELREALSAAPTSFTIYGYQQDPLSQSVVNHTSLYPTYIDGSWQYIPGAPNISSYSVNRFVSAYANAFYRFAKKYTLSGSFRKDASNVFGASSNDKWNPLWSSGIGWNISDEHFYKLPAVPHLQIRLSYGYSGNLDTRKTPLPVSGIGTNRVSGFMIETISALNNPALRWEKTGQLNLSIDFETKERKVYGSLAYYQKKSTDLYGVTPYDYSTWGRMQFITRNVADMSGKGIDLQISTQNINKALKWQTSFIYNYNSSKVTRYFSDNSKDIFYAADDGNMIIPVVGKPLYAISAYKWGGLNAAGDPQGFLNGALSTDYDAINTGLALKGLASGSIEYIGPSTPVHFGAILNSFNWKRLSFSVNMVYKAGYFFKKNSFTSLELIRQGIGHADYTKRWQQPGDEATTTVPALVYTDYPQFNDRDIFYMNATPNVVRGDHLRLHYINLAYEYKPQHKAYPSLQLYINIANLGIIWRANKYKLDPDALNGYPTPKQYTIGLRADF